MGHPTSFCVCVWYVSYEDWGYDAVDGFEKESTKLCPKHYNLEEAKKRKLVD